MKSLIALACLTVPAYAGNCHVVQRQVVTNAVVANAVVVPQGFIAVPFAVPVAVPSYVQYQALPGYGAVASAGIGFNEAPPKVTAQAEPEAPLPMSLVTQHCAKCHRPSGSAWKTTELDLTGELSNETRLHMIQRILSDDPAKRMPRGKQLTAQQTGEIIQELSQVPKPAPGESK